MARTRPLDAQEIRVLGALMEKEQTTPEYYPLTVKALVAACNQKSNREPVMELSEDEVRDTLERLRQDVLAWRTEGARSERWKHSLDRRWELDGGTKAIMTLLLLRGSQTPGELRSRSDRMHDFASVDEVEGVLSELATRFDALVRELPRRPGQRETRWIHLVGAETPAGEEVEAVPASIGGPVAAPRSTLERRLETLESAVDALRRELSELRSRLEQG